MINRTNDTHALRPLLAMGLLVVLGLMIFGARIPAGAGASLTAPQQQASAQNPSQSQGSITVSQ